jgi:type II secretory pathway component PulK
MMKNTSKHRWSERGVALLMVLTTITLLTGMIVEFAYNSHIAYSMSMNQLSRVKAYYLARSALGFARLQVQIEKDIRAQLARYANYLTGVVGSEPICKIMPFSTELFRATVSAGDGEDSEASDDFDDSGDAGGEESSELSFGGILKAAAVGDFLNFDGDFSVSCGVEDGKLNLNYFRDLKPDEELAEGVEVNPYESHKRLIESLLATPDFQEFFEDDLTLRRKLVNNIADWVDANTQVDESPGFQAGYEDQVYTDFPYKTKNGKFSTTEEVLLVAGMHDLLFEKLAPNITIYGDDKINLCLAEDPAVKAFVIRHSNENPDLTPIYPDNDELLDKIVEVVRDACMTPSPQANQIANAIRTILGLPAEALPKNSKSKKKNSKKTVKPGPKTLTEQIVTEHRYYSFDLTGSSGDIILNIKAVLDVTDKDPKKWRYLYYRIQ